MRNSASADDVGLGKRFDDVRRTLLQEQFADRLMKPLEYWVLPSDRRLPLALLGRSVGDLLATSFDELSATPGIGEKKIRSLVKLLNRATKDEPPSESVGVEAVSASVTDEPVSTRDFDPNIVSEALWAEWREAVRRFGIGEQRLGRLAPSLQRLPTVIWHKPLGDYLDHTVAQIRNLRTHGEKRVRCVLEVFHAVHKTLLETDPDSDLDRLLMPTPIRDVQDWVVGQLELQHVPPEADVLGRFAKPILGLIETDCGTTVARLVEERLGVDTEARSVRDQARHLGVTRARVYQLLDDCGKVMSVRWPEGRSLLDRLSSHYSPFEQQQGELRLFFGLCELCFPEKQNGIRGMEGRAHRESVLQARSNSNIDLPHPSDAPRPSLADDPIEAVPSSSPSDSESANSGRSEESPVRITISTSS